MIALTQRLAFVAAAAVLVSAAKTPLYQLWAQIAG